MWTDLNRSEWSWLAVGSSSPARCARTSGRCPLGVKPGKAPSEQKTSALPLIATVAGTFQIGSSVPESDSRRIRGEMLSCVAKLQRNLNLEEYKRSQSRSGG